MVRATGSCLVKQKLAGHRCRDVAPSSNSGTCRAGVGFWTTAVSQQRVPGRCLEVEASACGDQFDEDIQLKGDSDA